MADMGCYKRGSTWWVELRDQHGVRFRMSARSKKKRAAEQLQVRLYGLRDVVANGGEPSEADILWLHENLDADRRKQLIEVGWVRESRLLRALTLDQHVEAWEEYLQHGNTEKHARQQAKRVRRLFDALKAGTFAELTGDRIVAGLGRVASSQSTRNHYLGAVRSFCKWMVDQGRASKEPAGVRLVKRETVTERQVQRRALTDAEVAKLLQAPEERRIVYLTALNTGLRANELRTLTAGAIDLEAGIVRIEAKNTKNREADELPLNSVLMAELRPWLARRHPEASAFEVPSKTAEMVRDDLAGVEGADDVDFHTLRHTFITRLVRSGVYPKVAQRLARHSTIELTMQFYTHLTLTDDREAVEAIARMSVDAGKVAKVS